MKIAEDKKATLNRKGESKRRMKILSAEKSDGLPLLAKQLRKEKPI